jgi:hypothetical protein
LPILESQEFVSDVHELTGPALNCKNTKLDRVLKARYIIRQPGELSGEIPDTDRCQLFDKLLIFNRWLSSLVEQTSSKAIN